MNGVPLRDRDDLRARVALAWAGYNLSPEVSEAMRNRGFQEVMAALTIPSLALERADTALEMSDRLGVTVLSPASAMWPWQCARGDGSAPLVLWAKGQLDLFDEPLIGLSETRDANVSVDSEWAAAEVAVGLSDAGHVLIAVTHSERGQLVLRAARAMGGRWVAVSANLPRDIGVAPLGSFVRGLVVTASPPLSIVHRNPNDEATDLLSRLRRVTVDPTWGSPLPAAARRHVKRAI